MLSCPLLALVLKVSFTILNISPAPPHRLPALQSHVELIPSKPASAAKMTPNLVLVQLHPDVHSLNERQSVIEENHNIVVVAQACWRRAGPRSIFSLTRHLLSKRKLIGLMGVRDELGISIDFVR